MKRKRVALWSGVGVLAAVLAFFGWWLFQPSSLPKAADTFVRALVEGDTAAIDRFVSPQERQCSNLTPENLSRAYDLLIGSNFRKSKLVKYEPGSLSSNQTQASASARLLDPKGEPWSAGIIVDKTSDRPVVAVLLTLFLNASKFDNNGNIKMSRDSNAYIDAIRRHRGELESLGITRIMLNPNRCVTWSELESIFARDSEATKGAGKGPASDAAGKKSFSK